MASGREGRPAPVLELRARDGSQGACCVLGILGVDILLISHIFHLKYFSEAMAGLRPRPGCVRYRLRGFVQAQIRLEAELGH